MGVDGAEARGGGGGGALTLGRNTRRAGGGLMGDAAGSTRIQLHGISRRCQKVGERVYPFQPAFGLRTLELLKGF